MKTGKPDLLKILVIVVTVISISCKICNRMK